VRPPGDLVLLRCRGMDDPGARLGGAARSRLRPSTGWLRRMLRAPGSCRIAFWHPAAHSARASRHERPEGHGPGGRGAPRVAPPSSSSGHESRHAALPPGPRGSPISSRAPEGQLALPGAARSPTRLRRRLPCRRAATAPPSRRSRARVHRGRRADARFRAPSRCRPGR
jgi:hypothetical protein